MGGVIMTGEVTGDFVDQAGVLVRGLGMGVGGGSVVFQRAARMFVHLGELAGFRDSWSTLGPVLRRILAATGARFARTRPRERA